MTLSIQIWINILECLAVLRKRIIIENLKSLLFQSFWECSAHCCSTLPVLLETKGSKKGWEDDGWYHRCKSQLRPPALGRWFAGSGWNFEGRCQWKPNRSGWKGTNSDQPVLHNPSISYSLRMFEAGKEVCWPVTWEMVAPELGEARSFILLQFWVAFSNWWNLRSRQCSGRCS